MSHRTRTSVYYLSQLLIIVAAIATGSPARADDSRQRRAIDPFASPTTVATVARIADLHPEHRFFYKSRRERAGFH